MFSPKERQALEQTYLVGKKTIAYLEEAGLDNFAALAEQEADFVCRIIADIAGLPGWATHSMALQAVSNAIETAQRGLQMTVTIYHNPRCSKSRQTLALLEEQGIQPEVKEYLKTPLSEAELKALRTQLGGEIAAMIRSKEAEYKEQGLSKTSSEAEILAAIAAAPKLLERPIVVKGNKAAIGRPPEAVLDIL